MRENEIIAGNYKIIREIGHGGTGTVFLGYHLHLQKYVVLKETRVRLGDEKMIRTETDILKNLHHMYLPQVYDFIISGASVITVLDYVEGNDLSKYRCGPENLSEEILLQWLTQLAEVLEYLHGNDPQVVHSDIKPGNVIIRPGGDICLIDFNISLLASDPTRVIGYSAQFASPEQYYLAQAVYQGQMPGFSLDPATDIYSTGALFYYLMTGSTPNCTVPNKPLSEMGNIGYSSALVNIVDKCLQWERDKRYRDGAELCRAIRNYRKQSDSYRRMRAVTILCALMGAAVIGAGTYGVVRWRENAVRREYRESYAAVAQKLRDGDDVGAEQAGLMILGDDRYERYLDRSPQDNAELLHAMGDVNYNRGDYPTAAEYYRQALEIAKKAGTNLSLYYRDCAVALARSGQVVSARTLLDEAKANAVDSASLRLIGISCAYMEEDYASCVALAQEMENDPAADRDQKAGAAYFAGMAQAKMGNTQERIAWLTKAAQSGNITYEKMLADAYWEMAGDRTIAQTEQKLYALEACRIYEKICSEHYQTYENLMNLAIIQYYLQDYTESRLTLERCIEKYPAKYEEDYHLLMYKAFLYEEEGRREDAGSTAKRALEVLERTVGTSTDSREAEAVDRLRSLAR